MTHRYLRPAWRPATGWLPFWDRPSHDHGLGVRPGDQVAAIEGRAAADITYGDIERPGLQHNRLQFIVRHRGVALTNYVPVRKERFLF